MNEYWYDIKGYEGLYIISNLKRIRSLDRVGLGGCGGWRHDKGRFLKISWKNGCTLCKKGKAKTHYIDTLWETRGDLRSLQNH